MIGLPDFLPEDFSCIDPDAKPLETTNKITPRTLRAQAKARMINGMKKEELKHLIKELPEEGEYLHIISNGNYDYYNFIPLFIDRLGTIDELWGSTWTMNRGNVENLLSQFDAGKIKSIHVLTGTYFKRRETSVYATLLQGLQARSQHYIAANNHAKVLLMRAGEKYYVVEGSANWTANPRIEQNIVTQSRALYNHHKTWMEELYT